MTKKSIILSSSGIKNVVIQDYEQENLFTFKFGNKELSMNRFYAEFLSPSVSHLHQCDPTINTIEFDGYFLQSDDYLTEEILMKLQKISSGYSIEIDDKNSSIFRHLSLFLGNDELNRIVNDSFPIELNKSKIDELIKEIEVCHFLRKEDGVIFCSQIIEFIAGQFDSIDKQKIKKLPKSIIYSILTIEKFKTNNENELKDFIDDAFSKSNEEEKKRHYSFL